MQIETFKIFRDLVDAGSFSKAAALNSITQSAVSQQIRSLETRFQVMLLERGRRHFALTNEGQAFLEASKEILDIYENLGDRLHELRDVVAGEIKVAAIYSVGLHELPPYLKRFREAHRDVEVHVEYRRSSQVYAAVLAGEVDLGLVSYPSPRKSLQIEPFIKDRLVLICPPEHRLAKEKSISIQKVAGERFIAFEPDLPTRRMLDRHLREQNVSVNQVMEFDNIETVKRVVEIENAISIVPRHAVEQEVRSGSLCMVNVVEPEIWRPLGILLRRGRSRSPALKHFIKLLQEPVAE